MRSAFRLGSDRSEGTNAVGSHQPPTLLKRLFQTVFVKAFKKFSFIIHPIKPACQYFLKIFHHSLFHCDLISFILASCCHSSPYMPLLLVFFQHRLYLTVKLRIIVGQTFRNILMCRCCEIEMFYLNPSLCILLKKQPRSLRGLPQFYL